MGRFDTEQVLRRRLTQVEWQRDALFRTLKALRAAPEDEATLASTDVVLQIAEESWGATE